MQAPDLIFESFGFKFGLPETANFVFDVRCLPNPYYADKLRPLKGYDQEIIDFFAALPQAAALFNNIAAFTDNYLASLTLPGAHCTVIIAIGCTGGCHRSVYMAEKLAAHYQSRYKVAVRHRQLSREE